MRMSQLYAPTLREAPAEAEISSHALMLRAGLIRKLVSGVYSYLPLAYRTLRKIEDIVREEMNRAGGQEILMSAIQPAELWIESGRWNDMGSEMFRLKDRNGRQFCLGPTHEEIFTFLIRDEVRSYKQLPLLLYQIQTKYRDEMRPRFGLIRAREFIMKDLYSFDIDEAGLERSYEKMYEAYCRTFERSGLEYVVVEADTGTMGGSASHEFMVVTDTGEDLIAKCSKCGYAANIEKAECVAPKGLNADRVEIDGENPKEVITPNIKSIDELSSFLGKSGKDMIKTLIYLADGQPIAALVRGDREINEIKLKNFLSAFTLELADEATIMEVTGGPLGFSGPIGLTGIKLVADEEVPFIQDAVVGANQRDKHLINVNYGRDFSADNIADIRKAVEGDACSKCGEPIEVVRTIEVGHIFKLGTKYTSALGATFLDENGRERPMIMGCYGIGVTRTMAAIIEKNHDEKGIIWPFSVAPFHVTIVPINIKNSEQKAAAFKLYKECLNNGVEAVIDDRDERSGVKFNDADLIGFPIRITVGPRSLKEGKVEIRLRQSGKEIQVPLGSAVEKIKTLIKEAVIYEDRCSDSGI